MQSQDRLPLQPWMTSRATSALLKALEANGSEVRFVGGCVRDAIKGFPIKDIDLATPDRPEKVVYLLESAGLKAIPTGIDHGTVTAISHGESYEVTTLREDVETDGRRAKVAYTDDWVRDAARRDLTINALSCRSDGTLFDPFDGLEDLRNGRVRFVGNASERITEDYLRLLRFFRFHAFYGAGELDGEGLAAAKQLAPNLTSLSGERVRVELLRLLSTGDPLSTLASMLNAGVTAILLPEARNDTAILKALMKVEEVPDALLRLAALLDGGAREAAAVAERLRFSRAQTDRLVAVRTAGDDLSDYPPKVGSDVGVIRQALYDLGVGLTGDILRLDWAVTNAGHLNPDLDALNANLAVGQAWEHPVFHLRGRDALKIGFETGPQLGDALDRVEIWWRKADFEPQREDCLKQLKLELSNTRKR